MNMLLRPDGTVEQLPALDSEVVSLRARVDELLVSNNAFEQRAREAERALKAARETLGAAGLSFAELDVVRLKAEIGRLKDELDRVTKERAAALDVTSKDGLLSSEWLLRTGLAEKARDAALAKLEQVAGWTAAEFDRVSKERNEALAHFKEALRPVFGAELVIETDFNRLRRYFAWAKRAAHPGLAWPSAAETSAILAGLEWKEPQP